MRPLALFDDSHGQTHWSLTGFPSREWHTNFAGLAGMLLRRGLDCAAVRPRLLPDQLPRARLLVLPPPTGYYDPAKEHWEPLDTSLLTTIEVREILRFLDEGGRLLAFAYRFGDAFTQTNLDTLFVPLGLLDSVHNRRFLGNVLTWLLADEIVESPAVRSQPPPEVATCDRSRTSAKALASPSWMP